MARIHPSKWFCPGCRPKLSMLADTPCPNCCGYRRQPPLRTVDDPQVAKALKSVAS